MKPDKHKLDKIFSEKLKEYEVSPPVDMFDKIQEGLRNKRSKRRILFFRTVSAAAVIIFALIAGWLLNSKSPLNNQEIAEITKKETTPITAEPESKAISEPEIEEPNTKELKISNTQIDKTLDSRIILASEINSISQKENQVSSYVKETGYNILKKIDGIIAEIKIIEKLKERQNSNHKLFAELSQKEKDIIAINSINISNNSEKSDNWKIGVQVSPGYSSQQSSHSENYSRNMTYSNTNGNTDMSGGVSVKYNTGSRWSIESGVYYAQNGQNSGNFSESRSIRAADANFAQESKATEYFNTPVNIQQGQMIMNSTAGIINFSKIPENAEVASSMDSKFDFSNSLLTPGEFSQVFDFIEIPLYLRYSLVNKKIDVELIGGLSANLVVGNNVFMSGTNGRENIGETADISSLNYSGTFGIGVAYALGKRISLSVEPRLNYYLNSINKNEAVNYRPYRIGVYTGLNYEF